MEMDNALRAEVLIHALPFIQKYTDTIVVVKYGGNAMVNEELKLAVMSDVVLLSLVGIRVVHPLAVCGRAARYGPGYDERSTDGLGRQGQ